MSKHTKSYGKRGTSVPITSIQFDKSVADNSKRPSASKSAGVIGKWGTTSFTSLRSSQVNGEKAGKLGLGLSPVKCLQSDINSANLPTSPLTARDPFGFDSAYDNSSITEPKQVKPRKFFKSRGTDDSSKTASGVHNPPQSTISYNTFGDCSTLYNKKITTSVGGNIEYQSPSYTAPTSPVKRGRGRPRGSKNISPRNSSSSGIKPTSGRGSPRNRGRKRSPRSARGGHCVGRGKRKRQPWEDSESDESHGEDETEDLAYTSAQPIEEQAEDDEQEEEEEEEMAGEEEEEQFEKNGAVEEEKEPKPPIKLRIIRRNDSDTFVSKVEEPVNDIEMETVHKFSETPPSPEVQEDNITLSQASTVLITETTEETSPTTQQCNEEKAVSGDDKLPDSENISDGLNIDSDKVLPGPNVQHSIAEDEIMPIDIHLDELNPTVVQQKKSSIFKSRTNSSQASNSSSSVSIKKDMSSKGKKGLALYRHKWHEDETLPKGTNATGNNNADPSSHSQPIPWDDVEDDQQSHPPKMARVSTWPSASSKQSHPGEAEEEGIESGGSIKCPRRVKDYYTVVRNVKKAHQIQESGEFQEFNDDVDYILDALQSQNQTATRCLSAMSLAAKCMEPAFRMHLRAHSTVAKFFKALKDAPAKPSVALCTSCIMFVLTQDRLNMDLDRDSLELMLNLLETDAGGSVDLVEGKELEKNRLKVRELCEEMVRKGHAPHLQLDNITAAQLAMETLLSLTSKKAGEWFKEELRELGGLDHIIHTVTQCTSILTDSSVHQWQWDKPRLDALKKVDRCLRVLENITFQNEENQSYLLKYSQGQLVDVTLELLRLFTREIAAYAPVAKDSVGHVIGEALCNLMKVIMNLTHDNTDESSGSRLFGERSLTWETSLICLLQTPKCLPEDKRFDVMTLSLGILINLVERSSSNRERLVTAPVPSETDDIFGNNTSSSLNALIDLFISKEESARQEEARTDAILDGKTNDISSSTSSEISSFGNVESSASSNTAQKNQEDAMEETVKKLLHKAGRHMEDSMIAAYIGLLIGYVVMNNKECEQLVKELLPDKKFTLMVVVLKKFYEFLKLTANAVTGTRGLKNTELVIKFMEVSDGAESATTRHKNDARSSMPNYSL